MSRFLGGGAPWGCGGGIMCGASWGSARVEKCAGAPRSWHSADLLTPLPSVLSGQCPTPVLREWLLGQVRYASEPGPCGPPASLAARPLRSLFPSRKSLVALLLHSQLASCMLWAIAACWTLFPDPCSSGFSAFPPGSSVGGPLGSNADSSGLSLGRRSPLDRLRGVSALNSPSGVPWARKPRSANPPVQPP